MAGLDVLGQALQYTKKGQGTIPPESEDAVKKLEDRYAKIEAAMEKKMDRPAAKYADPDVVSDEERK